MSEVIRMRGGARLFASEMLPVGYAKVMAAVTALQDEAERLLSAVETADGFEVRHIEHLDFDPKCEFIRAATKTQCENAAEWVAYLACGSGEFFVCPAHRSHVHRSERLKVCVPCGFTGRMADHLDFVPLDGA